MEMSPRIPSVYDAIASVKRQTTRRHKNEIDIITGLLNTYTLGFNRIGEIDLSGNETLHVWLILVTRCFNSMVCASKLMIEGYYHQAITIIRSITEDIMICKVCPEDSRIAPAILRNEGELPKFIEMGKKSPAIYDAYRFQCKSAHSSGITQRFVVSGKIVNIVPVYDGFLFKYCMSEYIRVSVTMVEYLWNLIRFVDEKEDCF